MRYLEDLLYWIGERERIRVRKDTRAVRPWTSDPVLAAYRFCNVHREDDRVTKWIHDNWLKPHDGQEGLPFAMTVARMVNLPETLVELGYPSGIWNKRHFINVLSRRKDMGLKVWTSAYMITGGYSIGGESKEVIIGRVLDQAYLNLTSNPISGNDTLESAAEKIKSPGIGLFLSAQVVADLKHSDLLREASDWWSWCAPGPGSSLGLNFLHDRSELTSIGPKQFIEEVNAIQQILWDELELKLCAQNTQNCLCEFSKYVRAKHFGKRLKSQYVPA